MTNHPDIPAEQGHFDTADRHRERRRGLALQSLDNPAGVHAGAMHALRNAAHARRDALGGPDQPVAFWRMDLDNDQTYYIGRYPILDEAYDALVISWKSEMASNFPQSTRAERRGIRRKRFFETVQNTINDIIDEYLLGEAPAGARTPIRDAILRDLDRRRDGRLSDIIQTIEAAQDRVMRASSEGVLVVQGGPGTGKTVVGLQRLSVLIYRDEIDPDRMLFVGPTRGFLRYISKVLPALGDHDVTQKAVVDLGPIRATNLRREAPRVAAIKGDSRMAELLERAIRERRGAPDSDISLKVDQDQVTLSPEEIWQSMRPFHDSARPHNLARSMLRTELAALISRRIGGRRQVRSNDPPAIGPSGGEQDSVVRGARDFENLLDRVWPTFSPQEFLRDLLASERRLAELSRGLFDENELLTIVRPPQARLPDEPWTDADMALMDHLQVLLNGQQEIRRYEHVVVDEAQDLSPMQLLSIRRRAQDGVTILGDLAQATGAWAHRSWEEVIEHLGGEHSDIIELEIGYRVPGEVMAVAARIVEQLDLSVAIPDPIRFVGEEVRFVEATDVPLVRAAILEARLYLGRGKSVALITSEDMVDAIAKALDYEDISWADGREDTSRPTTVVSARDAKGLEFDAVVVVEPASIVDSGTQGLNELFVAMTRTTHHLSMVYRRALPKAIGAHAWKSKTPRAESTDQPDSQATSDDTSATSVPLIPPGSPESADLDYPEQELSDRSTQDDVAAAVIQATASHLADQIARVLNEDYWNELLMQVRNSLNDRRRDGDD